MVPHLTSGGPEILTAPAEPVHEVVQRKRARPTAELRLVQVVQTEDREPTASLHATPRTLEDHLVLPVARLPHRIRRGW